MGGYGKLARDSLDRHEPCEVAAGPLPDDCWPDAGHTAGLLASREAREVSSGRSMLGWLSLYALMRRLATECHPRRNSVRFAHGKLLDPSPALAARIREAAAEK
jgi:hypothetical protein